MRRIRTYLVAIGTAALATAPAALAQVQVESQPDGPVVIGERKQDFKNFELESLQAAIEFYSQFRNDRQTQPGQPAIDDKETTLRETLDISGQASIGHRNLLDLSFSANLGLEDVWQDSDTFKVYGAHDTNFVNLYNISGLILGNGPVPLTVYSRREESLQAPAFTGSVDNVLTESGVIAQIQSERAPTTLQYFHRETDQNGQFGLFDFNVIEDNASIQSGIRIATNQRLDITYTFDHIQESQPDFSDDYDTHDGNFVHTLNFGEENLDQLRSSLRFYSQTGEADTTDARWDEFLILRHNEHLETRYNFSADDQSARGQSQRLLRGDAQIRHWLFDSLISSATVGGGTFDADNATTDDMFILGSLDYTKKVYMGRIDSSVSAGYNAQSNSPRGGDVNIVNESHVFNDPFPIILSRRNIVPGSIVITGATGFPTYQEGSDYTVQYFPDRAEVDVIYPGGSIINGQTLLFDYSIGPEPGSDIDTLGTSLSVRYTLTEGALQGLAFYTIYRTQDNWLDTADPSLFQLDDFTDLLYGVEYIRAGLDVKAERETRDSTTNPYDINRLQAIYLNRINRDSDLRLDLTYEQIDYPFENNTVEYLRATGQWDQRFGQELDFNLRLEYRDEQSDLQGDSTAFEQILGFRWRRRQTTVYGSFRNVFVNADVSDTTSQTVEFGIRRAF